MIRELLNSLKHEDYAAIMEAFNNELAYIITLDDGRYIAVHFTPDPDKHDEKERSTYWSAGVLQ